MRYKNRCREQQDIPKKPRTKPAEVRLNELMSSAEQLFLDKGVEATTVDEIVELAQVAKGTFYYYFSSKNELLKAMGERYTEQFLKRIELAINKCDPDNWHEQLCAWIRESIDAYVETYRIHDIVYTCHHHNRSNREKNKIISHLKIILEAGVRSGIWSLDAPHITALLIYAGVHGAADDIISSPNFSRHDFTLKVISNCLRMVGDSGVTSND